MLLRKTLSLSDCQLKADGEAGRFAGYASVFGGVDSYGDTIVKGAFEHTLRKNGKPRMFFNHDWSMPVGKFVVAKEDDHGLYVEGEFTPGHSLANDVRAAMKHGSLDGLSIGGYIKVGDYDETESGRIIRRWSHLMEVSPVVFPADGAARIDPTSVKSMAAMMGDMQNMREGMASLDEAMREMMAEIEDAKASPDMPRMRAIMGRMRDAMARISGKPMGKSADDLETIRDFETFLRDAGGFSKSAAETLVARARELFAGGMPVETIPPEEKFDEVFARVRAMTLATNA